MRVVVVGREVGSWKVDEEEVPLLATLGLSPLRPSFSAPLPKPGSPRQLRRSPALSKSEEWRGMQNILD